MKIIEAKMSADKVAYRLLPSPGTGTVFMFSDLLGRHTCNADSNCSQSAAGCAT